MHLLRSLRSEQRTYLHWAFNSNLSHNPSRTGLVNTYAVPTTFSTSGCRMGPEDYRIPTNKQGASSSSHFKHPCDMSASTGSQLLSALGCDIFQPEGGSSSTPEEKVSGGERWGCRGRAEPPVRNEWRITVIMEVSCLTQGISWW